MIAGRVAALLLLGALTACSSDDSPDSGSDQEPTATTTAPTPAAAAPRPKRDGCYRISYDAVLAPTSSHRPVRCSARHTAETYYVGSFDAVVDGHLLAVDSDRVSEQIARACPRRFAAYVGGSVEARRLSMLTPVWFSPTVEQSDDGQSWFRCDVVAQSAPGKLARLTGGLAGVLDTAAGRTRWGRCATAKPGTEGSEHILCARDNAWRAVAVVTVGAGEDGRWPGLKAARNAGDLCEDKVRLLAASPFNFQWGYEWPTAEQWRSGQHYGYCWAPRGN